MSCTFWLRRKRLAALKQKEAAKEAENVVVAKNETTTKEPVAEETPKKTAKKTAKKSNLEVE